MTIQKTISAIILCALHSYSVAQPPYHTSTNAPAGSNRTLDLSGQWTYALDSAMRGEAKNWNNRLFEDILQLPGTLDDNGIGEPANLSVKLEKNTLLQLTRKHRYIGPAWYSREVTIPAEWENKHITLELERVIWETQVWVDGRKAGMNESIVAPHRFDLSALLTPGKHLVTIRIDNREKYDVSLDTRNFAHAYTDGTQIIWNGVIGNFRLSAKDRVFISNIQVYPNIDAGSIKAVVTLKNSLSKKVTGSLTATVNGIPGRIKQHLSIEGPEQVLSFQYDLGKNFKTWDEFDPHLYTLNVTIESGKGKRKTHDQSSMSFGMRNIRRNENLLELNNHRIFMRGTLECAIFPLTGYPPMEKGGWKQIFETARSFGLNHLRFHSWCPPKAAFEAADETGFYLQVELPLWTLTAGEDERINRFLKEEANRIIREYGNHPSFCFWSMGNELQGNFNWITSLLSELKQKDSRHLYTTTTFTFQKGRGLWPESVDDFYVTQYTKKGWVRGQGIFDSAPPNFNTDYSAACDSIPVPLISHEIGQYSIYPDLNEIKKYTGVLDPLNFKAIKQDLAEKGLLHQAGQFTKASGEFAVALYKEEIERALKTREFSGFQLLDLHDFPGQGTALVGILDAFWESKGLIKPEDFRAFCSPVVPLIRHHKAVYTNTESFEATVEIANFGKEAIRNATPEWSITDSNGKTCGSGKLDNRDISIGNGIQLGKIDFPLSSIQEAATLKVSVTVPGTPYRNSWKIWVYPSAVEDDPKEVIEVTSLREALSHLSTGKKVLLNPPADSIRGIEGKFVPVFWSPIHFPNQPGSMGLLCDPNHPVFNSFPTENHSDWQWWHLCKKSKPMLLDDTGNMTPLIQVIDNFFKNRKMATLVEAKVGKGKLMICSITLGDDALKHPEVRQLKYSILKYMNSSDFSPKKSVTESDLRKLFAR